MVTDPLFSLLDDATGCDAPGQRSSRLYHGWQRAIEFRDGDDVAAFFDALENAVAAGSHAVGLFDYEFGYLLQGLSTDGDARSSARAQLTPQPARPPLASIQLYTHCDRLTRSEVDHWLAQRAAASGYGVTGLHPALDAEKFAAAVAAIHRYIESGDTYQVNLTFPLHFDVHGDPVALYAALRMRQPVPYGALVTLPDGATVLSMSPELFVSHRDGQLTCRPMKGTAAVSGDVAEDAARAAALKSSVKERSENLMIVDLLRNDLGRIALTGSVKVPDLFSVERYGTVLQMTSTITATARDDVGLQQMFDALYPCGSITGAPKRRTMQLLQTLEQAPRRLYTGAIGWFEPAPAGRTLGDFMLSVPIRTLLLDAPDANDRRRGDLGVGAGIVYDSDALAEYQECLLKARFLSGVAPGFQLFETMHARHQSCRWLERHLARLSASAAQLGFACDVDSIRRQVQSACETLSPGTDYRLRVALDVHGRLALRTAVVTALTEPVSLLLSPVVMRSDDGLLAHKTTLRRVYDEGWQAAEKAGAFDALFFNERGELTEGGRSNVLLKLDGRWYTPPLSSGLLPGVMRQLLLEDPDRDLSERVLTRDDVARAEELCVCNALRGVVRAVVRGGLS